MKKNKFIIILVILGILAGIGGYVFISSGKNESTEKVKTVNLTNLELEEFLIKLSADNTYIKANITIGYYGKSEDVDTKIPIIRDSIIQFFMSKSTEELNHSNLDNLKSNLIKIINDKLGQDIVKEIYFTNLVVQ